MKISKIIITSFILIVSLQFAGCGNVFNWKDARNMTLGSAVRENEGPIFKPATPSNPKNSILYLYRPHSKWGAQELQAPSVFIEEKRKFGLKNNMYVALELSPGRYKIHLLRPLVVLHVDKIFDIFIDIDKSSTYYLRYSETNPPPEYTVLEGYVNDGPLYQVSTEFGQQEIRVTHSFGDEIMDPAPIQACLDEKTGPLDTWTGEDSETGVIEVHCTQPDVLRVIR